MMKKLLTVLITAATMVGAMAEVPSLINYQGRLKEKNGTNVNGSKNFTVRIFDAKTGGKQIYEENVGTVTVNEGAYSFGFGEAGKSVVTPTEILARTGGEKQVFNYITKHKPILGNVTISGAGVSWTDDAGSSDASKFTSTLNKNSGAASAIFLTQAPDSGTEVSISYDHNSDGVMGALSRGGQAWLGITVGGETLSPRERLVSVPYALRAGVADEVKHNREVMLQKAPSSGRWIGPINPKPEVGLNGYVVRKDYYFSNIKHKNILKVVASFTPTKISNEIDSGSVRMFIKLLKREYNGEDDNYKLVDERYGSVYSAPTFYSEQTIQLDDISVSGFFRIEYGIENVSRGHTRLEVLDIVLLLKN